MLGQKRGDDRADGDILAPDPQVEETRREKGDELVLGHRMGVQAPSSAIERGGSPVRGRHQQGALWLEHPQHLGKEALALGDVLESFEAGHEVERGVREVREI